MPGVACFSCSNGQGDYIYSHQTSTFADGYNNWRRKTVETMPDGNTRTVFTNFAGQVMLEVVEETAIGDEWITWNKYDNDWRLEQRANPSAISGYYETKSRPA